MERPATTNNHGTPPNTRNIARTGSVIPSSSIICSSLLSSLPVTIWMLLMGVVIKSPSVRWSTSSLMEVLSITTATSCIDINTNHITLSTIVRAAAAINGNCSRPVASSSPLCSTAVTHTIATNPHSKPTYTNRKR